MKYYLNKIFIQLYYPWHSHSLFDNELSECLNAVNLLQLLILDDRKI